MQNLIDENNESLQYFYSKRRFSKKQIKELRNKLKALQKYIPKKIIRVFLQQEDISIIKNQIDAYNLRIKWCTLNIKQIRNNNSILHKTLEKMKVDMELYFDNIALDNANNMLSQIEKAAWAAFFAI